MKKRFAFSIVMAFFAVMFFLRPSLVAHGAEEGTTKTIAIGHVHQGSEDAKGGCFTTEITAEEVCPSEEYGYKNWYISDSGHFHGFCNVCGYEHVKKADTKQPLPQHTRSVTKYVPACGYAQNGQTGTVTVNVRGGSITAPDSAQAGTDLTVRYAPLSPGNGLTYKLENVTVNGKDMTASNPSEITFPKVKDDQTVSVTYRLTDTVFAEGAVVQARLNTLSGIGEVKSVGFADSYHAEQGGVEVQHADSPGKIIAFIENNTLFFCADEGKSGLRLHPDSSGFFSPLTGLTELDMTPFDSALLQSTKNMFPSSLEVLTLPSSFRFSDDTPQGATAEATEGSGLAGFWHRDGETLSFPSQRELNTTLFASTFEGMFNADPAAKAGTWLKGEKSHYYWAKGQAATVEEGNIWEIHHPENRFFGYCFAQHLASPNGRYERTEVTDINTLYEILGKQNYICTPAGANIQEALIAMLYFGYPSNGGGLQEKYGLTDAEFSKITWGAIGYYEAHSNDKMVKKILSGDTSGLTYRALSYTQKKYGQALQELIGMTYASVPASLKEDLHLFIYVSQEHQQHLMALEGLVHSPRGGAEVVKKEEGSGLPLKGAEFTVYDTSGAAVRTMVSDADGRAALCRMDDSDGVLPGTYTVRETKAPAGYDLSTKAYTFTVTGGGQIVETGVDEEDGLHKRMVFENHPTVPRQAGGLRLRKVDAGNPEQGLPGAVFGVYNAAGTLVTQLYTDENGSAKTGINELDFGIYMVKELTPPAGYRLSDTTYTVEITVQNAYQENTLVIDNEAKTGKGQFVLQKVIPDRPDGSAHKMEADRFRYELYRVTYADAAMEQIQSKVKVAEAKNDAAGKITFPEITFNAVTDLGQVNFIAVEIPGEDGRYEYDTKVLKMQMICAEEEGKDALVCTPGYIDDPTFTNAFTEPEELPAPHKEVSGGLTVEEKRHNAVYRGYDYTYHIFQTIPQAIPENRYRSFSLTDSFAPHLEIKEVSVFKEGTDITDRFTVQKEREAKEGTILRVFAKEEYLADEGFYDAVYEFRVKVNVLESMQESRVINKAISFISFVDDDNRDVKRETNEVITDILKDPVKDVKNDRGISIAGDPVEPGQKLTYEITCRNPLPAEAEVTVTDTVPEGTKFLAASQGGQIENRTLQWKITIPAGEERTVSFTVEADTNARIIKNRGEMMIGEYRRPTNEVVNAVMEAPKKAVFNRKNIEINKMTMQETEELVYRVTWKNPFDTEKEFTVTDTLPDGLEFVKASDKGMVKGQTVTWKVTLKAKEEKEVSVSAKIKKGTAKTTLKNTALVTAGTYSKKTNEVENPVVKKPSSGSDNAGEQGTVTTAVVEPIPGAQPPAAEVLGATKGPEGRTGDDKTPYMP